MAVVKVEVGDGGEGEEEEAWRAAKLFMAKGPSATLQFLKDEPKALLYALDAQAMEGPFLSHEIAAQAPALLDPALVRKQEAWKALGSMSKTQAKRAFVQLLSFLLPHWKDWHPPLIETHKDEASRILSAFMKKTGLKLRSSL
ncbi:hypothetical protein GOP47_0016101 [Adiantum capillus-veneris]|uniref:ACB domain-containing protein n=1 Tax=Adiantum capillus-veneris TaxID=13818 RepID=A0A9D4UL19_ADICA|nr:hypothetical protein GOP47_0016101 [Adiantum capillus-veneris]